MGMQSNDRLEQAVRLIDSWIEPAGVTAAGVVVRLAGEVVAERYAGELEDGQPVTDATLFALASVTKPITASAVLAMVDDGLVSLDEAVARFLPEFGAPAPDGTAEWEAGRGLITVRQVLSHTSGMPEDLPPRTMPMREQPTLETITNAMIRAALQFEPGTALRYSNAGYGVLGRLVERATGRDLWEFARTRVLSPAGLDDLIARPGPVDAGRIASVIDAGAPGSAYEPYQSPYWRNLAIPWGGLFGTPTAAADFAEQFTVGGRLPLSHAARMAMTSDQANGVSGGLQMLKLTWHPAFWGLGWEVKGTKRRHWTGDYTSPATFCHWGAAGTLVWSDPTRQLTVAAFGNRLTVKGWPFYPVARWARLSNAIVAAVS
jgi:beta-lactamase class C